MNPSPSLPRLARPSLNAKFHIDYGWWGREERELRVYLLSHLCDEHRTQAQAAMESGESVDYVDPETAEVRPMDPIQHMLAAHCSRQPDYLTRQTSLVDAVFRVFLANGNMPLTPDELAERTGRPGITILRTLAGGRVYKGLRPVAGRG